MIIGVDFGAPREAAAQRRKLVAIAAEPVGPRAYRVSLDGWNARLRRDPPGWTAEELAEALLATPARVVGCDVPFCVPQLLLDDPAFAPGPLGSWRAFNELVARRLPFRDPLDFTPFAAWRDPANRARLWARRAADLAVSAQPPLKDRFQATFQMTLLGNAVLARLRAAYTIRPFRGGGGQGEVIEVYPGGTLRALGLAAYKARPAEAMRRVIEACTHAGIELAVERRLLARCARYSSGTPAAPDHDLADAFVALGTAILYAEGHCHAPGRARDGAIWVPAQPIAGADIQGP